MHVRILLWPQLCTSRQTTESMIFIKNQNTMNEIPYSMPPFSMTVSKQDELAPAFKQCLSPEAKESSHQCIKERP